MFELEEVAPPPPAVKAPNSAKGSFALDFGGEVGGREEVDEGLPQIEADEEEFVAEDAKGSW